MDYKRRIRNLLESNEAKGAKIDELVDLQLKNGLLELQLARLTGEFFQHKRLWFGKRSEKSPDKPAHDKGKTKDVLLDTCTAVVCVDTERLQGQVGAGVYHSDRLSNSLSTHNPQ